MMPGHFIGEFRDEVHAEILLAGDKDLTPVFKSLGERQRVFALDLVNPGAGVIIYRAIGEDEFELDYIYTEARYRGQGLGGKTLKSWLELQVVGSTVHLEVHSANMPAIELYKAVGFIESGRRQGHYSDGGEAVCFSRHINEA